MKLLFFSLGFNLLRDVEICLDVVAEAGVLVLPGLIAGVGGAGGGEGDVGRLAGAGGRGPESGVLGPLDVGNASVDLAGGVGAGVVLDRGLAGVA